jgi:hypothetical protein
MVSPMTLFTPEDLLLYLYKVQLVENQLEKVVVAPRMEVILKVLNYARETAVESTH